MFSSSLQDFESKGRAAGGPILNAADVDAKERELQRRIQDLEGETKRSKIEIQDLRQKLAQAAAKMQSSSQEKVCVCVFSLAVCFLNPVVSRMSKSCR